MLLTKMGKYVYAEKHLYFKCYNPLEPVYETPFCNK